MRNPEFSQLVVRGQRQSFNLAPVIGGKHVGISATLACSDGGGLFAVCNVEHGLFDTLLAMLSSLARRALPRAAAQKRFISTTPSRRSDALFVVCSDNLVCCWARA